MAHEIGHLKFRHVKSVLGFTLAINVVYFGALWAVSPHVKSFNPTLGEFLSHNPFLFNCLLGLLVQVGTGPVRRRNEHSADLFALKTIGSYETVASALAKVHLYGGAPHTYLGFDRLAGSHPSLMKRLDSLRQGAAELSLPVDDGALRRLIDGEGGDIEK